MEWAKEMYPFITPNITDIEERIPDLPICIFLSRDVPATEIVLAIPYKSPDENPTNTRILSSNEIPVATTKMLSEFSQAFLFLVSTGALPSPKTEKEQLTKTLVLLTNKRLMMA